jgi:hypothetical protein
MMSMASQAGLSPVMSWREVEAFAPEVPGDHPLEQLSAALAESGISHHKLVSDQGWSAVRLSVRHVLALRHHGALRGMLLLLELDELRADEPVLLVQGEIYKTQRVGTLILKTPAGDRCLQIGSVSARAAAGRRWAGVRRGSPERRG